MLIELNWLSTRIAAVIRFCLIRKVFIQQKEESPKGKYLSCVVVSRRGIRIERYLLHLQNELISFGVQLSLGKALAEFQTKNSLLI